MQKRKRVLAGLQMDRLLVDEYFFTPERTPAYEYLLTELENMHDELQLRREYEDFCSYHVNPPSFETFKRQRKHYEAATALAEGSNNYFNSEEYREYRLAAAYDQSLRERAARNAYYLAEMEE